MKVTILGCGGSGGVPLADSSWGDCDPADPRNRRRRPAILIEHGGRTILVDTGPDLREQLVAAGCRTLDAVFYTHAHADHVHGVDDMRALNHATGKVLPAFGSTETLDRINSRFGYVFDLLPPGRGFIRPQLDARRVEMGRFDCLGLEVEALEQDHGFSLSTGFRIGGFAYSTDVVNLEDSVLARLHDLDLWVVDCLREEPHPTHAHLERVLGWIERIRPRRVVLTHMNHETDYATMAAKLPAHVEPGVDGLTISF